jgi:two-component system, LytTR family, response regulator
MKPLTAVVVDDERLARKELISMLNEFKNINVLAEADSVKSASEQINLHQPDIVFLDIQMPGESGFDLLNQVDYDGAVIFVTAYDEYALRAFEVNALDYLLKPVVPERLNKSIERVMKGEAVPSASSKPWNYSDRLFIMVDDAMRFIKISSIVYIEATGDYSNMYTVERKKGLVFKTMKEWEERLPESSFCRVHRSHIVNIEYIDKVEKWVNYSYQIHLKGVEEPLILSRRYAKKLKLVYG